MTDPDRLLAVDPTEQLAIATSAGGRWQAEPLGRTGLWPAAAPGSTRIALSRVHSTRGGTETRLEVYDASVGRERTVHRVSPAALIAPRLPYYALWAPDGRHLSYVAPTDDGLSLFTWNAIIPGAEAVRFGTGAPIFHAWHPTGSMLAVHRESELDIVAPEGGEPIRVARGAVGFRVPAWSDDGALLVYGTAAGGRLELRVHERGASEPAGRYPGAVSLAFEPGSRRLAVGVERAPGSGVLDALYLSNLRGDAVPRLMERGPFTAYAWSPNGERLLLVGPTQSGDGLVRAWMVDADGDRLATSEPFLPSADFRTWLGFFDQYRLSHPIWAPSGEMVVLGGRTSDDGLSTSFGDPRQQAFVWGGRRGEGFQRALAADFACFGMGPGPMVEP